MKAILIDPHARTVTEVQHDGTLEGIYRAIGADCVCTVSLGGRDAIFLDDDGLFREGQEFFAIGKYPNPLAGRGLVLGCDAEGESTAPKVPTYMIERAVHWLTPEEAVAMNREAAAAMHASAAVENARDSGMFHIASAPLLSIDSTTGKARAA